MKNAFLILVFLNAVFFLWLYSKHSPQKVQPNTSADVQTLEMYAPAPLAHPDEAISTPFSQLPVITGTSEPLALNTPESNQSSSEPKRTPKSLAQTLPTPKPEGVVNQPAQVISGNKRCVLIGPIADKGRAVGAQEYLASQGYQARWEERSHTGGPVKFAYRVFIPPYPSFSEAKETADKLKENGIDDFYIITKSDTKQYAISLGVFSRLAGVKVRSEQLNKIGFKTEYEAREREQETVFWVMTTSGKTLSNSDKTALGVFGVELSYTKKSCTGV